MNEGQARMILLIKQDFTTDFVDRFRGIFMPFFLFIFLGGDYEDHQVPMIHAQNHI